MFKEPNRIRHLLPEPRQSVADKLMCGAWSAKIELTRFASDDGDSELSMDVEIRASVVGDEAAVLAALLREFRTPRGGEGAVSQ